MIDPSTISMIKTTKTHSKTVYLVGTSAKVQGYVCYTRTFVKSDFSLGGSILVLGSGKKGAVFVGGVVVVKLAAEVVVEDVVPVVLELVTVLEAEPESDCCRGTMYTKAIVGGRQRRRRRQ
jgi:hypothetical protein